MVNNNRHLARDTDETIRALGRLPYDGTTLRSIVRSRRDTMEKQLRLVGFNEDLAKAWAREARARLEVGDEVAMSL
jgi:hypothetical protein